MSTPAPKRLRLGRSLDDSLPAWTPDSTARPVSTADSPILAQLMFDAYRGTPDDEGGDLAAAIAEVQSTLSGAYGPFDYAASEVIVRDGMAASATLVTHYQSDILIAFSMTAPSHKRQGLARSGLIRTLHRLRNAGHAEAFLAVAQNNEIAKHLYESLGFILRPLPSTK